MNEQDWKALARLSQSPEGRRLIQLLQAEREECRDQLEKCRDVNEVARLQGQVTGVAKLIEQLTEARDVVEKRFTQ